MRPYENRSLLASVRCASQGLWHVLRSERNARYHVIAGLLVLVLSAWLRLSVLGWCLVIVAITLVFVGEMLNTVVERLVDLSVSTPHSLAGQAKDVAAGAVLVASVAAALIGILVLVPPLWERLSALFR